MPIPVINYAGLPPSGDQFQSGLAESIQNGFKMRYLPDMLKEQLRQQQLANALAQVQAQYAPQMTQAELEYKQQMAPHLAAQTGLTNEQAKYFGPTAMSEIGLRGAQTGLANQQIKQSQFNLANPLLQQTGAAGQLGALAYMQQHPELFGNINNGQASQNGQPSNGILGDLNANVGMGSGQIPNNGNMADLLKANIFADLRGNIARTNLNEKLAQGYSYSKTPIDTKRQMLAQAAGMGVDPNEASEFFTQGGTVAELAQQNGLDPKNLPDAIFPSTNQDISKIKFRQQALQEINTLNPILTEALAPYAQRVNGFSPKQIAGAIKGDDPDAQAKFLAARGLQPEMSALRLKAMGGQVGIEAIKEVQNASLGNIKAFESLVSPEVYQRANQYMDQWINQGVNRANSFGLNPQLQLQNNQQNNQAPGMAAAMQSQGMLSPAASNLQQMARDAIMKGANPQQVQARLQQMLRGGRQ